MPRSFDRIIIHTTFSTKYRDPWIDEFIEPQLHSIMAGSLINQGCKVIQIGGTTDHVHLLHTLPRTKSIAKLIGAVKSQSSSWLKEYNPELYALFSWQEGYGAFSVDYRRVEVTANYIRNQKAHHGPDSQRMTFRQEFEIFVEKFGLQGYDPNYNFPDRPANYPKLPSVAMDRSIVETPRLEGTTYTYPSPNINTLFTVDPAPITYRTRRKRQRRLINRPPAPQGTPT